MKTQVVIKNVTSTIDYYNAFLTIQKRIKDFPSALLEELENSTFANSTKVENCSFMRLINYSNIMSWSANKIINDSRSIDDDKIKCFANRLDSYASKGNIDAIVFTIERIKKGNRARIPKRFTKFLNVDEKIVLSKEANKHFDFYNEGIGYIFNDDEKKFIFEFVNKYFNIKE